MLNRTAPRLQGRIRDLVYPRWATRNGYSKMFTQDSAIPGMTAGPIHSRNYTAKAKWFEQLYVPFGGYRREVPKGRHALDGTPGALDGDVTDICGVPTMRDSAKAAQWAVERKAKYNKDYRIPEMPDGVERRKPVIRPVGAVLSLLRRTQFLRKQADQEQNLDFIPAAKDVEDKKRDSQQRSAAARRRVAKSKLESFAAKIPEYVDGRVDESMLVEDPKRFDTSSVTPPSLSHYAAALQDKSAEVAERIRAHDNQRPWDALRPGEPEADADAVGERQRDPFGEAMQTDPLAVVFTLWFNEWDTQVKIVCPWDNQLLIHRSTAELPWVLESQWNSGDAARELLKDSAEDFHAACRRKGYLAKAEGGKLPAVVLLNGFWQARSGAMQGFAEILRMFNFTSVGEIAPAPLFREEHYFPKMPEPPKIQNWRRNMRVCEVH